MSAAEKHIAELEAFQKVCRMRIAELEAESERLHEEVGSLRKQLVQRDVYEAEQRLPPEHAVLIKHLATVEKCIAEGPVTYHYAEESDCSFCHEWQGHARDCKWVELQMDRGVTSVLDDIHEVALLEHERRGRQKKVSTANVGGVQLQGLSDMLKAEFGSRAQEVYASNPLLDMISAAPAPPDLRHPATGMTATEGSIRAAQAFEHLRLTRTASQYEVQMQMPDAPPVAPNLGIGGEEVAPPDEDDVP